MTLPDESQGYVDPFDDVFGSVPPSPAGHEARTNLSGRQIEHHPSDPSDIPRLRGIHVTNGYREGVAASKESHVQEGFDEGYPLGAEVGMKTGWCLGALDGILHAVYARLRLSNGQVSQGGDSITAEAVQDLLSQAKLELTVQKIFGEEYFGADGIWLYEVPSQNDDEEIIFREVASAHPLLAKWDKVVLDLAIASNFDLGHKDEKLSAG